MRGNREDGGVWSSCGGKQERSQHLSWESKWGSTPDSIIQTTPFTSQSPGKKRKVFTLVFRWGSQLSSSIWRTVSPNLDGHDYRKPLDRRDKILMLKVGCLLNLYDVPDYFKLGLSWEKSGPNDNLLGLKTSEASEGSSSRHTLSKRKSTHSFCAWIRLKSLEMKYLLSALRTTGSFTRSLIGWFRPHVSGGVALEFQTVFQGMSRESHRYRDDHGTVFLLWSTFLITEHKIAKKASKLSNMTSIEYSTQCHLMFQRRLFLILIFLKEGVVVPLHNSIF